MLLGSRKFACFVAFAFFAALGSLQAAPVARNTGPWDVKELAAPPTIEWGKTNGLVREVYYTSVPLNGQPTRVFGYYAKPAGEGPFPAMVLLHGGGGKAFAEWAKLWAERGYVALAMDLAGKGPDGKRLEGGGPDQDDVSKFGDFQDDGAKDRWTYHAVAAALKGHSLLAAQKEVDPTRIGVTGISWGGYLTCIVAGVDERMKVAVPVYGCGFIHEDSCWVDGYFQKMSPELNARWVKNFDPSSYLAGVTCPILFVNGTNDFAYPLDSYQKSYRLVDEQLRNTCVTVNMPHGHVQGWNPKEIGLFVDNVLKKGEPLAKLSLPVLAGQQLTSKIQGEAPLVSAELHYTLDDGPWQKRTWKTLPAKVDGAAITVDLPAELTSSAHHVYFFTARAKDGAVVSSEHVESKK